MKQKESLASLVPETVLSLQTGNALAFLLWLLLQNPKICSFKTLIHTKKLTIFLEIKKYISLSGQMWGMIRIDDGCFMI